MNKPFNVPVVFPDLDRQQALHQVFDSLVYLEKSFFDTFDRIDQQTANLRSRVDRINQRAADAQAKCQAVSGSSKATTVMSAAKFPAADRLHDVECLFKYHENIGIVHDERGFFPDPAELDRRQKRDPIESFFVEVETSLVRDVDDEKEGLGRLPDDLPSVTSLLLFNTNENPYKTYATLDNLLGKEGKDRVVARKVLTEAPTTIIQGDQLGNVSYFGENISFRPQLGEVPIFNLPAQLNLPKVAQINASFDFKSIAPSLPSLPAIEAPPTVNVPALPADPASSSSAPPPPPPPPGPGGAAPPPPPPPPPPGPAAPPPPPPPPPPGPAAPAPPPPPPPPGPAAGGDDDDDDNKGSSGGGNDRSSLLAEIRNPGKKLRRVRDGDAGAKESSKKKAPPAPSGGDMMSELFHSLTLRRQGMGGKKPTKKAQNSDDEDDDDDKPKAIEAPKKKAPPPKVQATPASDDDDTMAPGTEPPPRTDRMASVASYLKDKEADDNGSEDSGEWD